MKRKRPAEKKGNTADQKFVQTTEPVTAVVKTENQTAVAVASQAQPQSEKQVPQTLARKLGLQSENLAVRLLEQATELQRAWTGAGTGDALEIAMATLSEMEPESVTQTMLAIQMSAVHDAAVVSLRRAAFHIESSENPDMHMDRANKLMRLFVKQADAMARLKGKTGQQRVEVTHVHLNAGAQAVIGTVSTAGPKQVEGGSNEKRNKTP